MRWSVYKVVKGKAIGLGYVNAPHVPAALLRAFDKWPEDKDGSQVQAGFSVRVWKKDYMALGKLHSKG